MKAIDTNILIRFLVGDDNKQAKAVYNLFKDAESRKEELFVPLLVVLELIWVLESVYAIERSSLLDSVADLLIMPVLKFEHSDAIQKLIITAKNSNCDLSDLLIAHSARDSACEVVYTFDKKAAKHELFELIR